MARPLVRAVIPGRGSLWPPELEALRAEARAAAVVAYGALARDGGVTGDGATEDDDPHGRIVAARAGGASLFPFRAAGAQNRILGGVGCRVLIPDRTPVAVYLHFHGGGMAIGTPELNDAENLVLATELDMVVVSVDYRLAPEHPYPAAIDDGITVAEWLIDNSVSEFGTDRILTGGESSGAYLAAMMLLRVRDELGEIRRFHGANLVFGVFDWGRSPSQRGFRPVEGPDWLTPERQAEFGEMYLPGRTDDERRAPTISPAFADLGGLPPALFTIGTLDHLFDDSITMAARYSAAGSPAELAVYPDCGHGFQWFTDTEMSRLAVSRIHRFLREVSA